MRYYWKRQAEFRAHGLTTRGTKRKYTLHHEFSHLHGQARKNARARLYRKHLNEQGMSARRNPLNLLRSPMRPLERAWRQLRATMVINTPEMLTPLER